MQIARRPAVQLFQFLDVFHLFHLFHLQPIPITRLFHLFHEIFFEKTSPQRVPIKRKLNRDQIRIHPTPMKTNSVLSLSSAISVLNPTQTPTKRFRIHGKPKPACGPSHLILNYRDIL
jgi:hypothetical protein